MGSLDCVQWYTVYSNFLCFVLSVFLCFLTLCEADMVIRLGSGPSQL